MKQADVVVIGGGVHGASAAYHLAKAGRAVVLLEQKEIGSGASGRSGGIIRCHYSTEPMVRLALRAAQLWPALEEELGSPIDYVNNGLVMLVTAADAQTLKSVVAMQKGLGADTDAISLAEVQQLVPGLNPDGLALACHERLAGYADPYAVAVAFGRKARATGVEVCTNTPVRGIRVEDGAVRGVLTDQGEIRTPVVINAAGAWAGQIGRLAGLELPLQLGNLQMTSFRPDYAGWTPRTPTMVDMSTMTYARPDTGGLVLCGGGLGENESWEAERLDADHPPTRPSDLFEAEMAENLGHRIPWVAGKPRVRSWCGLDGSSPDFHLIFGEHPQLKGFVNIVGGSGNSFKLSPATGEAVAELLTTGRCTHLDLRAFSITRFAEGRPFRGRYQMHIVG